MPKRWVTGGVWAVVMSAGLFAFGRISLAQQAAASPKTVISDVIITGNKQMSIEQIKVHLHTQPGEEYKADIVDEDVRELYKTNQISNITTYLQEDGFGRVKICFSVREMPNKVQKVTFLGAKHIKPDDLQNIIGVRPGVPLNPDLNRHGCRKIIDKYAGMGRSFSDCQLIKGGEPEDTEVVYQITEGPKTKVREIQFTGNNFAGNELLKQMVPARVGGTYNRKIAEVGMNALYAFYRELGFRDVRIALEVQRDSTPGEVSLIYHIHEELRYRKTDRSSE